ncbi:hypothetical protein DA718_01595 [Klebsiella huaxiensis]|nr:hypothetical protein DA718_01595 [Klebsiella huaxiensis]
MGDSWVNFNVRHGAEPGITAISLASVVIAHKKAGSASLLPGPFYTDALLTPPSPTASSQSDRTRR